MATIYPVVTTAVGDPWVGKSSFHIARASGAFLSKHVTAEEVEDVPPIIFDVSDDIKGRLDMLEISGDLLDFNEIRYFNYRRSDIIILTFSVVRPTSLENIIKKWLPEVKKYKQKSVPYYLVGTQCDLREDEEIVTNLSFVDKKPVTYEQGLNMAKIVKAKKYIECSAKTKQGIHELFDEIINQARGVCKKHVAKNCHVS